MNARNKSTTRLEVLEEVAKISDNEVDGDPKLVEMSKRLDSHKAGWRMSITAFDVVRFRLERLPIELADIRAEIAAIEQQRPASIAAAIMGGGEFVGDNALLKRRAALALQAERLELARPALEAKMAEAGRRVEVSANPVTSLEAEIELRRRELKLALAESRCA